MGNVKYVLGGSEGHTVIPEDDIYKWAAWFEKSKRVVARSVVPEVVLPTTLKSAVISTVFLGLDHNYGDGPPLLFETLVFGGPFDGEMERYSTWEEAVAGHARMVQKVNY